MAGRKSTKSLCRDATLLHGMEEISCLSYQLTLSDCVSSSKKVHSRLDHSWWVIARLGTQDRRDRGQCSSAEQEAPFYNLLTNGATTRKDFASPLEASVKYMCTFQHSTSSLTAHRDKGQ